MSPEPGEKKKYCPSCGTTVPVYTMFSAQGETDRCQYCSSEIPEEGSKLSTEVNLNTVFVVEDTDLIREMISDMLQVRGLAKQVIPSKNGAEFLYLFAGQMLKKNPPGLIILDVVMPILNGINAAVALRSVEKAFGPGRAPILFFTVKQCDDAFRKVLKYCSPAMYINKGRDASPDIMRTRVDSVIAQLWKEMGQGV